MNGSKDAQIKRMPWPKDDEIRWVEWRILERESIEAGRSPAWNKSGAHSLTDYRVWLLHERDHQSFQKIGDSLFANCAGPENRKRRADLAHDRVEGEFGRGHVKRNKKRPGFVITAFGVLPRE